MIARTRLYQRDGSRVSRRRLLQAGAVALISGIGGQAFNGGRVKGSSCTIVEVYPGYPGYAGYITGVDGVGDQACLEDLEANNPNFSKTAQDSVNRLAAKSLGIDGVFEEWTWENWLGIEAERRLYPVGYYYTITAQAAARKRPLLDADPDDARILIGDVGSVTLLGSLYEKTGLYLGPDWYDFDLRILASLYSGYRYPNATQILVAAEMFYDNMFKPGIFLDAGAYWGKAVRQGGWFPMHPNALPEDQAFGIFGVTAAMRHFLMEDSMTYIQNQLQGLIREWLTDQEVGPLSDWLVERGVAEWVG